MPERRADLKAAYLLRDNIRTLLAVRKEDQVTLARWCGHGKSWINKFLNMGRDVQVRDLDKIASFFGIEAYQLFQPGISRVTERRKLERRSGEDRRIGHAARLASSLQSEVNKLPRLARRTDYDFGTLPAALQAILARTIRDFQARAAAESRGQAPSPRRQIAGAPPDRRNRGGSDPETP